MDADHVTRPALRADWADLARRYRRVADACGEVVLVVPAAPGRPEYAVRLSEATAEDRRAAVGLVRPGGGESC